MSDLSAVVRVREGLAGRRTCSAPLRGFLIMTPDSPKWLRMAIRVIGLVIVVGVVVFIAALFHRGAVLPFTNVLRRAASLGSTRSR